MLDLTPWQPAPSLTTTVIGERILAAAESLFYAHGIAAVGVDRVAETAQTTKRTLYQRFGSKDALVAGYLDRRRERWQRAVVDALAAAAPTTPAEALGVFFDAARSWNDTHTRGCAFVNAWAELADHDHPGVEVVRAEKRWVRGLLTAILEDDALARDTHLRYEGALVATTVLGDRAALTEAEATTRRLLAA